MGNAKQPHRTAAEAGWHVSRYNIRARVPGKKKVAIANLFKGTCAEYSPLELYLMSVLDEIADDHPVLLRLSALGVIANFDELAALETMGRCACAAPQRVDLAICPTMGCNFDCPYCYENHPFGKMSAEVQDDVVALARRMLKASAAKDLGVTWFGGEPLLAPEVIEALSARLIALAKELGATYDASIITNGYLLTPQNVAMLKAAKVTSAQVTIDGLGAAHDATRHLAGGGATFERIVQNLRQPLPFAMSIRHNVHQGNRDQVDPLKAFVDNLARESGNKLGYYPTPVTGSSTADKRGKQVGLLCGGADAELSILQDAAGLRAGRGSYCGAHALWSIGIDDKGNLQKCWEAVDKPGMSFGTAHDWNPKDPLATASNPNNLTMYLNTAPPVPDEECRACVWLPTCVGGCPHQRLFYKRACPPYKDDAEAFVLALHDHIRKKKGDRDKLTVTSSFANT